MAGSDPSISPMKVESDLVRAKERLLDAVLPSLILPTTSKTRRAAVGGLGRRA